MVPCIYFFYPETAYRSLEELDEIFHEVRGLRGVLDVVRVSLTKARRYGRNGELLIGYETRIDAQRNQKEEKPCVPEKNVRSKSNQAVESDERVEFAEEG